MPHDQHRHLVPVSAATRAFIGLGANLGDLRGAMERALAGLDQMPGTRLVARSSMYVSAPIDAKGPDFLNAVAEVSTELTASGLLAQLQAIESLHGRERPYRNAPRTLDLDLLVYGDQQIALPTLTVPHPRLHQRAFVLRPLAEMAPQLWVPGLGRVGDLLMLVADQRIDKLA